MKRLILFYALLFAGFTVLYIFLFHMPVFLAEKVLFYRGIFLIPIALVLTVGVLIMLRKWVNRIRLESVIAGLVLCISLNLVFFVLFPVTFDRSVTMYLLNDLRVNSKISDCAGLSKEELRTHTIDGYIAEGDAVGRRLSEQAEIGLVEGNEACTSLTSKAKAFLWFAGGVSKLYGLSE